MRDLAREMIPIMWDFLRRRTFSGNGLVVELIFAVESFSRQTTFRGIDARESVLLVRIASTEIFSGDAETKGALFAQFSFGNGDR